MALTKSIIPDLQRMLGAENVLLAKEDLIPYSFDGTAALKQMPEAVIFPRRTGEVSSVLKMANETRTPVVTRGAGAEAKIGTARVTTEALATR